MLKKHFNRILILLVNIAVAIGGVLAIKNYQEKKIAAKAAETTTELEPLDEELLNDQEAVDSINSEELEAVEAAPTQEDNNQEEAINQKPAPAPKAVVPAQPKPAASVKDSSKSSSEKKKSTKKKKPSTETKTS